MGYIKLYRDILKWRHYGDSNTKVLFIHCMLNANYEPKTFRGQLINRGQFISSYSKLSTDLGISVSQIRTCIKHLTDTEELLYENKGKYSLLTVVNYDKYQNGGGNSG